MKAKELLDYFQQAKDAKNKWIDQAKEDYRFVVGDQWDDKDKKSLRDAGKIALTLNKIQALIFLISGIQRQNRSDFKAFPVGEEDSIKAEAVSYLLKDMVRNCDGDYKQSEQFEDGIICGEGWIEPYIDYTQDLLNGNMKLRKRSPFFIFRDPAAKEYGSVDNRFMFIYTPNISKEMLYQLYPEKKEDIDTLPTKKNAEAAGNIADPSGGNVTVETQSDYANIGDTSSEDEFSSSNDKLPYDMIEAHYYKQEKVYLVVDRQAEENQEGVFIARTKKERDAFVEQITLARSSDDAVEIVIRYVPVPRIKVFVCQTELDDFVSPFYPNYKLIPIFSFYAHWLNAPIEKQELLTQGIVNSLKDPQREINKRRSQELHHLNSSTNSGWLNKKKGGISNRDDVAKYGSSSGFIVDYDKDKPERITPAPLSSGHEALAQLANSDIKEISGINTDLLAQNDKASSSGRAIHLRQQQGLMMIQRILDNFSRTQRELGRFFISQIGEVYDIPKAKRAIGEGWIKKKFSEPILVPRMNPVDGQPIIGQDGTPEMTAQIGQDGQMVMQFNQQACDAFFKMLLDDATLDRYDVVVGAVATSETIRLANYTMMMEFAQQGIPIPPDILIDESMLTTDVKERIKKSVASAAQSQMQRQ